MLECTSFGTGNVNATPTPSQATINAMNYLWFMTYQLNQEGANPNDPVNLQMLAKAIGEVATLPSPLYGDPTGPIWSALTGGTTPPTAGSPAALAAAYLKNPQDPIAEKNFMNCVSQLNNNNIGGTVNSWWGEEGFSQSEATINHNELLVQGDVQALDDAINAYMSASSPTDAQLQAVIAAVKKVQSELSTTSNLDPYSQMLSDILNTPTDLPMDQGSTLVNLANQPTDTAFGQALNQCGNELYLQIQTIINKEWNGG